MPDRSAARTSLCCAPHFAAPSCRSARCVSSRRHRCETNADGYDSPSCGGERVKIGTCEDLYYPASVSGSHRYLRIWQHQCGWTTRASTSHVTPLGWRSRHLAVRRHSGSSWTTCSASRWISPTPCGTFTSSKASMSTVIAVVLRVHHVMADGLALHAAARLLLDLVPRPPRRRVHDWSPERVPGSLRLAATALADRTCRQAGMTVDILRNLFDPRRLASNTRLAGHVVDSAQRRFAPDRAAARVDRASGASAGVRVGHRPDG